MWNANNSTKLINKIAQLYGEEMIYDSSNSVEGLAAHLDEMVAIAMNIDKNIITTARKWRKIIQRAAISDRIDKVNQILNQEETQTLIQASETYEEIKEIEMLAEDKLHNKLEANTQSKKTIEVEMEISKENSQTDQISDETKIKSIDISADLLEIKPESKILEEKFERLDKEIKLRPGNNALEGSIWAPKITFYKFLGYFLDMRISF